MPSEWRYKIATIRVAPSVAAARRVTTIDGSAMSRARRVYIADEISASLRTAAAFKCVACGWKMTIAAVGRSGDSLGPFAQRDNDRVFGIEQILDHGALKKIRIGPVTPPGALSACRVEADFGWGGAANVGDASAWTEKTSGHVPLTSSCSPLGEGAWTN